MALGEHLSTQLQLITGLQQILNRVEKKQVNHLTPQQSSNAGDTILQTKQLIK